MNLLNPEPLPPTLGEQPLRPALYEGVETLATPREVFEALLRLSWMVERRAAPLRLFSKGKPLPTMDSRTRELRPLERDGGVAGWVGRLEAEGVGDFGLIANYAQDLHHGIGERIRAFVARMALGLAKHEAHSRRALGVAATVQADLFVGNYRRGFFGLHKDEFHVFTFPVLGLKRYLVWPFERFLHLPGSDRHRPFNPEATNPVDFEPAREEAAVLMPVPAPRAAGECAFWPAEAWHCAEALDSFHASIGIGLHFEPMVSVGGELAAGASEVSRSPTPPRE